MSRSAPHYPLLFAERVRRMAFWAGKHPSLYPPLVIEARLVLGAWYGSAWRAGWAMLGRAVADLIEARVGFPLRLALHRLGWHDRVMPDGGCSLCEAQAPEGGAP